MKRLLFLVFSLPFLVLAQNKPLVVEGTGPDLFITHKVAPKENYYSIGRIYNVSPREMAPYNKLEMEAGLTPGQTLKIPLSAVNFIQSGNPEADEVLVPVYHTVSGKEGLFRISSTYNKLPVATLRQWNNLSSDVVSNGAKLIVGYLKVKRDLSPLVAMAKPMPALSQSNTGALPEEKPVAVKQPTPAPVPEVKKAVAEVAKPVETVKKETPPAPTPVKQAAPPSSKNFDGGAFKPDYDKQVVNKEVAGESGEAAVFKSTSGWEDGKYYCLHNSATPGTIVKVTNANSGKSIYAKVLDVIPDIKQNTGLLVRISNAAANALGAQDTAVFNCTLNFAK